MAVQRSRDSVWRKRVAAIQRAWEPAHEGEPSAVHQLRVASRRVREVLPVVSDGHRPQRVKRTRRKMRRLTRLLGPIRERDVSLTLLGQLEDEHPEDRAAIEAIRNSIVAERKGFYDKFDKHVQSVKLEKLVKKLTRIGSVKSTKARHRRGQKTDRPDDRQWRLAIAGRVARRAKQLKQAVEHAGALYAPNRLHEVRLLTKKLRYALEAGHEAGLYEWQSAIRSLKEVQDTLGELQDREALVGRLRTLHVAHSDGSAAAAVERLTRLLEDDTRRHHARFVSQRDRLLKLCATLRQQATHAIPIARPKPTRVALRPVRRAATRDATAARASVR